MNTERTRVALHAPDHITHSGLAGYLGQEEELVLVAPDEDGACDVTVLATDVVEPATLGQLRRLAARRPTGGFLLIPGRRWKADIAAAVECGVRGVLWRADVTPTTFLRALISVREGGGALPPALQGELLDQVQRTYREVLIPQGLAKAGPLTVREADILRLISEGRDLAEISEKLAYSERTVKNVLYRVMERLHVRNRAHAVSYAIRSGLI